MAKTPPKHGFYPQEKKNSADGSLPSTCTSPCKPKPKHFEVRSDREVVRSNPQISRNIVSGGEFILAHRLYNAGYNREDIRIDSGQGPQPSARKNSPRVGLSIDLSELGIKEADQGTSPVEIEYEIRVVNRKGRSER